MDGKTHLAAGILAGIGIATLSNKIGVQDMNLVIVSGSTLGALLPDIDIDGSMLGRFIPLWLVCEHRTITHSLFFMVLAGIVGMILRLNIYFIMGLIVGIITHLILDGITPMGLPYLLYPLKHK